MKLLSLFSGIGAFEKALDRLKVEYELVGFSEIDKYAVKSYCAIHDVDESMNLGDITKINEQALPKDIDLITYGFPCQDISNAGHMKGLFNEDGTQTRSGLFFEALRIIEATQPRVAIAENVKNLTSKKFAEQFKIVLDSLEAAGYNNYWQVLNAKDFGIPQNRERVFIVSIRKDIDTGCFRFPEGFPLELRLKDLLEDVVDEKFYIKNSQFGDFISERQGADIKVLGYMTGKNGRFERHQNNTVYDADGLCPTQYAGQYKDPFRICEGQPQVLQIGNCCPTKTRENPNQGRIYDTDGLAPCLNQMGGGNRQPFVTVREATKQGYAEAFEGDSINLEQPNSSTRRGRVGHQIAQTLTTSPQQGAVTNDLRIRKLTPKECFRLMNFEDSDFEKAEVVNSNTQLYKQAGNSIVIAVPYYIIKALIEANIFIEKENKQMELRVNEVQLPEQILFNYEELKQELTEKVSHYETLVYTDSQIKEAKADKANLNKLKKALNDERIRREKEYMQPFNDFKAKINEIISIIDKPVAVIDKQVKEYEEKQKQEKRLKIQEFFDSMQFPDYITLERIMDDKWLNASVSMKSIQEALVEREAKEVENLLTLSSLPEFGFEATEVYKRSLDMNTALNEGKRLAEIAKAKAAHEAEQARLAAEAEAMKQEREIVNAGDGGVYVQDDDKQGFTYHEALPQKQWVSFKAFLSTEDALALKSFFESRNIQFEAI